MEEASSSVVQIIVAPVEVVLAETLLLIVGAVVSAVAVKETLVNPVTEAVTV